jgi:hypothetical protein
VTGLLDRYLGRTGYDAQQYDGPADPDRPHNLWEPVPGTQYGAHGDFDQRAHATNMHLWLTTHRSSLAIAALAGAAVGALAGRR